ncbi:MAG: glycine cleavage system protein GcvH [bacterium]
MNLADLRYTKDHEWIGMEGGLAVMGISQHAQQALGDITFVDLPKVGKALKRHDVLGVVESVKAASDIFAPVAGTVAAANEALGASPELINQDPCGRGWICKLSGVNAADLAGLMTLAQYEALCASAK